ncbi:GTP cyclohydrolase II [Streptomyces lincolnensis]|uniref:GTP cyclohydrolase-2 n=1 Tax=Streptomyces lincolnensis TaxID=1915 RepID=A0A1B1MCQ1_STRLN|nr:GTP cyclohydrolase II [Streptomyces lincolnensis]ANS66257.1 GTP cyclohydrolase II [Streptomyces lincolnensis]AXG55129.1 GTP cyclohydrolase II [Streptomyces lincolnensis]QMV08358.1 GTP cyclohydrolase II RibA [Streptomyces lincolnensis]
MPDHAATTAAVTATATPRSRVRVPLRFHDGYAVDAELVTFHGLADGQEHVAVVLGDPAPGTTPLVRLHSECLTGDVFGSARCDCGPQLREAVERIADRGGILLYLRQEGRGIGLYNKLDAYALQDQGLDTYAANTALGLPEDARDYTAAAQMLQALGVTTLDLLSNNPDKAEQLRDLGIAVRDRVPTGVFTTAHNVRYLRAKVLQTQHTLPLGELTGLHAG